VTGTGAGAAAIPHTVQYPSSMVPPQPGWVQVAGAAGAAEAGTAEAGTAEAGTAEAGTGAGAAAIPHTVQ
jgi:hypothetical protein